MVEITGLQEQEAIELEIELDEPEVPPDALPDEDIEIARQQAVDLYREIRAVASLPPAEPDVTGIYRFSVSMDAPTPFIVDAEAMLDERRFELAVVCAQTACEVAVRSAMQEIYKLPGPQLPPMNPSKLRWSLKEPAARILFFAITGRDPHSSAWWGAYSAHVTRRNHVAHEGAFVTETDARDSIDAMWSFINFVRDATGPILTARREGA